MHKTLPLLALLISLSLPVLAQPALPQHPALAEFDLAGQAGMRTRVQAVINRPADLSPEKVTAFGKARQAAEAGDAASPAGIGADAVRRRGYAAQPGSRPGMADDIG